MAVEIKLTQRLVDGLDFDKPILRLDGHGRPVYGKPNKGQREWRLRDTELPGLQLRITPGSIGWYVNRRMGIHPGRLRSIGGHPDLSVAEARSRGRKWLALMAEGKDPLVLKKEHQVSARAARQRDRLTMKVAYEVFQETTATGVRPSTVKC